MLEIGIDGAQDLPTCYLPAADHGHGESAFPLTAYHAQLGEAIAETRGDLPRAVGAIVVHHDYLVPAGQGLVEGVAHGGQKIGDILALVQGRYHQREHRLRAARDNGRDNQRARGRGYGLYTGASRDILGLTTPWG